MRVRVWIGGAEGPAHDFELVDAPRVGDHVSVSVGGRLEEGIVTRVSWQLQAIEPLEGDVPFDRDPLGSVSMVHVICHPTAALVTLDRPRAEVVGAEARPAGV